MAVSWHHHGCCLQLSRTQVVGVLSSYNTACQAQYCAPLKHKPNVGFQTLPENHTAILWG